MLTLPLHPYQSPAVDRFLELGALLVAYEMGLGKTPIAIACAEELLGCEDIDTCLLVVPSSLKFQWAMALAKFTDMPTRQIKVKHRKITVPAESGCVIMDGPPARRRRLYAKIAALNPDYVIMSYDTVCSDTRNVRRIKAGMTALDEASAIKNFGSERTLAIKRTLMSEYRLALTGTPVENRPEEAFSIMEWVDPEVLGSFDLFEKSYIERWPNGSVKRYKNMPLLFRRLSLAMERRNRTDPAVAPYLPEVDHDQWYVDLDADTKDLYNQMADDLLNALLAVRGTGTFDMAAYYTGQGGTNTEGLGRVMARQSAIKMGLDHPELLAISAKNRRDDDTDMGSQYCDELEQKGALASYFAHRNDVRGVSPKLDFLADQVHKILQFQDNKLLIFSRFPEMLELIAEAIGVKCVFYHGGMTPAEKAGAVQQFTDDAKCRVFLSSHAGAYGTDMHMANYLINYDLPWSGGTWDQINGRHQRVSSEFGKVFIRDIIMRDTTEERDLAALQYKLKVSAGVVDGRAPRSGRIENDLTSLTDWLSSR